jgi:hypothetical protein
VEDEGDEGVVEVTTDGYRKKRRPTTTRKLKTPPCAELGPPWGWMQSPAPIKQGSATSNASRTSSVNLCRVFAILSITPTDPSKDVGTR